MNTPTPTASPQLRQRLAQALSWQQQGRLQEAEALYRDLLAEQPRQPEALHYLGLLAHQTGRDTMAEDLMRQSLVLDPANAGFIYNFGGVLAEQGRWQEAVPCYQRALELGPANADAWHGLAQSLQALGHSEDALACWQRGVAAVPSHLPSWLAMADVLHGLHRQPEEVEACRQALVSAPRDAAVSVRLAEALTDAGSPQEALQILKDLLQRDPSAASAHFQRGLVLSALGDFVAARGAYETALRLDPTAYQALVNLAGIKKIDLADALLPRLQAAAADAAPQHVDNRISACFALGKIYEDNREYAQAFPHYLQGNRLQRRRIEYSTDAQTQYMESMRRTFDRDFVARYRAAGDTAGTPLFIVGMPRSGTTLVEQILCGHPGIHGGGELTLLSGALRRSLGPQFLTDFTGGVLALDDDGLRNIGREYLQGLRRLAPQAQRITDKMPSNFMHLGLIHTLFPQARIIHCRREPLDTCLSCFVTLFRNGQLFSYDLQELGEFYRLYRAQMTAWRELLPAKVLLEVDYEMLVDDIEGEARRMLAHCGLDWDPAVLGFNKPTRMVLTASAFQVRQPLYRSSLQRWRRYVEHLHPLADALGIALPD